MNSKRKGNSFEILVSKQFSKFLTNDERDDIFWRSINSGGLQTVREQGMGRHAGDVAAIHPLGELLMSKVVLECKNYKDIGLWTLIKTPHSKGENLSGWWDVHLKKANEVMRHPVLIAKQNHKPVLFLCHYEFGDVLHKNCNILPTLTVPQLDVFCFLFESILETDVKQFKKVLEVIPRWQGTLNS